MGCDTFVALPPATRNGVTLFAKNSDRPPREAQRIVQVARRHGAGAPLRCQYVTIPDVPVTAAVVGSQPHWLWGFEHGVNEHRVAIGNETVFCKEVLGPVGLVGMDLVRLGLERARTATGALDVMTGLIETHGQGGSGHAHVDWPYHNAFLIADPTSAWILETSGRHWAAKPVEGTANLSNGLAIGREWTRASADVTSFAIASGWWPGDGGRVDFAGAYNDDASVPPNVARERRRRGAALLAESSGQVTAATLRGVLRDHYDAGPVHRPRDVADARYLSICMHGDPLDDTTASMVMELPRDADAIVRGWVSLGTPCVGAFVPCYPEAPLPARLALAAADPDPTSPWWRIHALATAVARDRPRYGVLVRERFDELEHALTAEAGVVEAAALRSPERATILATFMSQSLDCYLERVEGLIRDIS